MRLINVEVATQTANHDRPATAKTTSASGPSRPTALPAGTALPTVLQIPPTFSLHAIAKFLNAIFQILLGTATKILRAALRAANADGLRGIIKARATQWQTGGIATPCSSTGGISPNDSGARFPGYRGKRITHREIL